MSNIQSGNVNSSASSQTLWKSAFLIVLVSVLALATSCSNKGNPVVPNGGPVLKGIISMYNDYDGAMLNFTKADMEKAGFTLGDLININVENVLKQRPDCPRNSEGWRVTMSPSK